MRIIVIGAGLLGITTAYYLRRHGHDVIVVDRCEGPGLETSFANGGMITPSQAEPWNMPGILGKLVHWLGRENAPVLLRPSALLSMFGWGLAFLRNATPERYHSNTVKNGRLGMYSLESLRQLRADTGIRYDEAANGTMRIFRDQESIDSTAAVSRALGELGLRFEVIDRAGIIAREPALAPVAGTISGGIYYPDDESGDAYRFCVALAEIAARAGVDFRYGFNAQRLERAGDRIRSVTSPGESLEADRFVLAAGSYSPMLASGVGLRLPIQPVKGYSLTLDPDGSAEMPRVPVIDEANHIATTPLGSRLRVAGTAEFNGYDTSLAGRRIQHMQQFVSALYPALVPDPAACAPRAWAGLRPYTCDGVPLMGRTALNNLFLNTGHGHLGWSLCAGSGRLVADLVSVQETDLDIVPYELARFG